MDIKRLVGMVNDIARFYTAEPDREVAERHVFALARAAGLDGIPAGLPTHSVGGDH